MPNNEGKNKSIEGNESNSEFKFFLFELADSIKELGIFAISAGVLVLMAIGFAALITGKALTPMGVTILTVSVAAIVGGAITTLVASLACDFLTDRSNSRQPEQTIVSDGQPKISNSMGTPRENQVVSNQEKPGTSQNNNRPSEVTGEQTTKSGAKENNCKS